VGPGGVVVGSANLSGGALIRGTEEAAVLLTDSVTKKAAINWVKSLANKSLLLDRLKADAIAWGGIVAAWKDRQRRVQRGGPRLPSVLDALRNPYEHDLTRIRIDLVDKAAPSIGAEADRGAKRKRIKLPSGWGYTYVDGPPAHHTTGAFVRRYAADVKNCVIFSLIVALDKRLKRVTRFTDLMEDAGTLLGTAVNRKRIIWY